MKRIGLTFILLVFAISLPAPAQNKPDNSKIDMMLIRGEFNRAIDTCKQILAGDSLNSEIYYKLGLAYQNQLSDDKSFECFLKATTLSPANVRYSFMVAKDYYNNGKVKQAEPLLLNLCTADSLNWSYAYYLTSIYMQRGRYDESIKIYNRFLKQDSLNYAILDKIGFAFLRKGDFNNAIDLYNRSLALNNKNTNAIKNLSYLYSSTNRVDTALQLLTMGIKIDPDDMDFYVRRGGLNYLVNYTKRALDDYLKILRSGDSSFLYLKRAGIGYFNNLQPKESLKYLLIAYSKDSSDYETASYLGQIYNHMNDPKNSIHYYKRVIKLLTSITQQMGIAIIMLAEAQKTGGFYKEAITSYLSAQKFSSDNNLNMIIANLYDEKLKDTPKAIYYYELFLDKIKKSQMNFKPDYIESVKERVEFLKNPNKLPDKK
ncbi:MAG: tetratricopeptide repeat protein [Bacteroidales bacterium]